MQEFIDAMSDEDIAESLVKYANNESVVKLLSGILEARVKGREEVKVKLDFEKGITKLFAKLPHPEDIHNVYVRWGEVEVVDGEPEELSEDVCKAKGLEAGTMRAPSHKEYQWIVLVNHAISVRQGASTTDTTKAGKRKVKDIYRLGSKPLELLLEGYGTWADAIRDINENHQELLRRNSEGKPELIIETTASGLQDLRTAGFLGVER